MRTRYVTPMVAATLIVFLSGCENSASPESSKAADPTLNPVTTETNSLASMDLDGVAERMRQTSMEMRTGIQEARTRREALEVQHAAERKRESERARLQANKDATQLAAIKNTKERQAAESAQAQARQDAAERAAKVERERLAALEVQRALEEKTAKAQAAKAQAPKVGVAKAQPDKAVKDRGHMGAEIKFGVDM